MINSASVKPSFKPATSLKVSRAPSFGLENGTTVVINRTSMISTSLT